jgi:hypothetical protein
LAKASLAAKVDYGQSSNGNKDIRAQGHRNHVSARSQALLLRTSSVIHGPINSPLLGTAPRVLGL